MVLLIPNMQEKNAKCFTVDTQIVLMLSCIVL